MDKIGKSALKGFAFSILIKSFLFTSFGVFASGNEISAKRYFGIVLVAILVLFIIEICIVFYTNYSKHLILKKQLGEAYEQELELQIQNIGLQRLFYSWWMLKRWKEYQSENQ